MGFLDRIFKKKPTNPTHQSLDGHEMVSLVLLSKSYIQLDCDSLREHLDSIWPGSFLPQRGEGNFVIDGPVKGCMFLVQSNIQGHSGGFMIHSVPGPYDSVSDYRSYLKDSHYAKLADSHQCWFSVDLILRHGDSNGHYRFIGGVIAKLAPPDALLVLHPTQMRTVPFDETIRSQLALDGHSVFQ